MQRRRRVYLSGPISLGDRQHNLEQANAVQIRLLKAGFAPLNPILTMLVPGCWEISHEHWIAADLPWIEVADAVLRLPGESVGADLETKHAVTLGIPVFFAESDLMSHYGLTGLSE